MIQQTSCLGESPPSPTRLFPTVLFQVSQLGFMMPCNPISGHYGQRAPQKAWLSLESRCRPALLRAENPSLPATSSGISGTAFPCSTQGARRARNRSHPKSAWVQLPAGGQQKPAQGFPTQAKPRQDPLIPAPSTAASSCLAHTGC